MDKILWFLFEMTIHTETIIQINTVKSLIFAHIDGILESNIIH